MIPLALNAAVESDSFGICHDIRCLLWGYYLYYYKNLAITDRALAAHTIR